MSCSETNFAYEPGLQRLFAPGSVAVVDASASEGKVGHQAVLALADFPGEVFPINPSTPEILGRKAFRSLREGKSPGRPRVVRFTRRWVCRGRAGSHRLQVRRWIDFERWVCRGRPCRR